MFLNYTLSEKLTLPKLCTGHVYGRENSKVGISASFNLFTYILHIMDNYKSKLIRRHNGGEDTLKFNYICKSDLTHYLFYYLIILRYQLVSQQPANP